MKKNAKQRNATVWMCQAGLIGALYTVITVLIGPFGSSAIQCRVSEALCVLPVFTSAAIPGVTLGCLLSNLLTNGLWQDVVFGTMATLIGAIGARCLRRLPWLAPLPTVVVNVLVVPHVLAYAYHVEDGIPFLMLTVGIGELLSAYGLGMLLWAALRRTAAKLFPS